MKRGLEESGSVLQKQTRPTIQIPVVPIVYTVADSMQSRSADGRYYFEDVIPSADAPNASIKYRHPFREDALLREVAGGPYAPQGYADPRLLTRTSNMRRVRRCRSLPRLHRWPISAARAT